MTVSRGIALVLCLLLASCSPRPEADHRAHAPEAPGAERTEGAARDTVRLNLRDRVFANVATASVVRRPFRSVVSAQGRITYDESRKARVTARVEGRLERLYVSRTGARIRKGMPLAEIYSPDLVSTQQELLIAAQSLRELSGSAIPGVADDARRLIAASRKRLELWGLSEAQIDTILRRGTPQTTLTLHAPASGVILEKMVQEGDWVDMGMTLYSIVDLSRVWVEADVYEFELSALTVGMPAKVEVAAYPDRAFEGRVSFIQPVLNAETRTNVVRVELANPQGRLKPDMYATVTLASDRGLRLVVPEAAVLDTGKRQKVWVEEAPGRFVARDVRVGARSEEGYEILSGLAPGEPIAVTGAFMLDASSQLTRGHAAHGASTPSQGTAEPAHRGH